MSKRMIMAVAVTLLLICIPSHRTTLVSYLSHETDSTIANLLEVYGMDYQEFEEIEIGDKIIYFQQRRIGEILVEKDFILYQFDKDSKELVTRKAQWRSDLSEYQLPRRIIPSEKAESIAPGEAQFSELYIISPESDVFPIQPTPKSPCWVVRSIDNGRLIVTVIDALNGKILGNGIPPPYSAFSMSGPCYFEPCGGVWYDWYKNAELWFNEMGYSAEAVEWPTEEEIKSHVQSNETAVFYEIAHSGGRSDQFKSGCLNGTEPGYTYAYEIEEWIANYTKMPFSFLASCFSMCNTSDGSLSDEFRKGSTKNTVTIGYCNMSGEQCGLCWTYSLDWQDALFNYLNQSYTIKEAFDQANAEYPACAIANCMRFVGDEDFKIVPNVKRVPFEHDVAITRLSSSRRLVGKGFTLNLRVFAENQGSRSETFNVTAYANATAIGTIENVTLSSGGTATLSFTWNSANVTKGNYILSATATSVPDETETDNNVLIGHDAIVTIPGDVDGDRDVDIYDIVIIAGLYGEIFPPTIWAIPPPDIDGDGDIDIYDVVIAAGNYGESW